MLYFLPNVAGQVSLEVAASAGLSYAFESPSVTSNQTGAGPDGGPGMVFAADGLFHPFDAGHQTWRKHPARDYWAGVDRRHVPTPDQLARGEMLPGQLVKLADGRQWIVPIARGAATEDGSPVWYEALPQRLVRDDAGKWVPGDVIARYEPLWSIANQWSAIWERMLLEAVEDDGGETTIEVDDFEAVEAAVAVLGFNYRIGPMEADLLGLLDFCAGHSPAAQSILLATIDWDRRIALQKKTDPTTTTSAGGPGSGEDTGRQ